MNRRMFLALGVSAALSGKMAYAQSFADSVVDQLRRQGFASISVGRTLLGRTRIVAEGNGGRREIILNPRTGEILRDFWQSGSGSSGGSKDGSRILRDDDRNDDSGRGRGRGGDDRNDDREDDRSDREDNSGSGHGGGDDSSGSGGGDDDSDDDDK